MTEMSDRPATPRAAPTVGARGRGGHAREAQTRIPIWNEVIQLEEKLLPAAVQELAKNKPVSPIVSAAGLVLVLGAAVAGALQLDRLQTIQIIRSRPRLILQGGIPSFAEYVTWENVVATYQLSAIALGAGIGAWLLLLAVNRSRRFARRYFWVPALIGVAVYVGITWYVEFVMV